MEKTEGINNYRSDLEDSGSYFNVIRKIITLITKKTIEKKANKTNITNIRAELNQRRKALQNHNPYRDSL